MSWRKWIKQYNPSSEIVVWIKVNPLRHPLNYLKYNDLLSDLSLIEAIINRNMDFRIAVSDSIGKCTDKRIFYNISEMCNPYKLANYSNTLHHVVQELERQGNRLYPKPYEVQLWENKGFMQRIFKEVGVNHPNTHILARNFTEEDISLVQYPVLIKEIHSAGSRGVHKVNTREELISVAEKIKAKGHTEMLVQQLVNMRKDLRVVILGDKITLFYWRVNSTSEWKPTATSFGNNTEFGNFPVQWESAFFDFFRRLQIPTCAFDITWENDDLSTMPLVLEISPSYQPNPALPAQYQHLAYKEYKKKLFVRNAYHREYVDVIIKLKSDILDLQLSS
jgi:glutathione synthase/RimK-type ligase-like ATP-grasp enzyme